MSIHRLPRPVLGATTLLLVLLVAGVDLSTGQELSFFVFYFIPVGFAAWTLNLSSAVVAAFLCTGGWLGVETLSGRQYSHSILLVANVVIRASSYTLLAYFVFKLKQSRLQLHTYATQLEERVAQRTAQLEERVSELETFSYSVSHNLRAPLRAMEGLAHAIEDSLPEDAGGDIRDYLRRIKSSAERMDRLVLDLLEYVQLTIREPELRPTELAPIIAEAIDCHKPAIEQKRARIVVENELPMVWAQNRMLYAVLSHLLSNSLKFSAPHREPLIRIATEASAPGWLKVSVSDNGVGIHPQYHDRVFGLFEQMTGFEASGGGTGMGLAIAKKCIEKMGGKIGVQSDGAQGASIWFQLKMHERISPEVGKQG